MRDQYWLLWPVLQLWHRGSKENENLLTVRNVGGAIKLSWETDANNFMGALFALYVNWTVKGWDCSKNLRLLLPEHVREHGTSVVDRRRSLWIREAVAGDLTARLAAIAAVCLMGLALPSTRGALKSPLRTTLLHANAQGFYFWNLSPLRTQGSVIGLFGNSCFGPRRWTRALLLRHVLKTFR